MIYGTSTYGQVAFGAAPALAEDPSAPIIISASIQIAFALSASLTTVIPLPELGRTFYPAQLDTTENLLIAGNNGLALLENAIGPDDLTLTAVGDITAWPSSGALTIDLARNQTLTSSEICFYEAISGQEITLQSRGKDGTAAKDFDAGAIVELRNVARHHNVLAEAIVAIEHEIESVESQIAAKADSADVDTALLSKLDKSGGTMTGALVLSGAPSSSLHAATKAYVDSAGQEAHGTFWVSEFGASGSSVTTTGSISSGSNQLTVASPSSFEIGQGIYIAGAGSAGAALITSITAIGGSVLTLAVSALTTVTGALVQHDDTAALQSALNLLSTYYVLTLLFDNGTYRVNGAIQGSTNSILNIPFSTFFTGNPRALRLIGQDAPVSTVCVTPQSQGTIIQSNQIGVDGNSSIFAGNLYHPGPSFTDIINATNLLTVDIKGMTFRTYNNPNISALDLAMCWNVVLENVNIDTGVSPQGNIEFGGLIAPAAEPTHNTFGLRLPRASTVVQTTNISVSCYSIGVWYADLWVSVNTFIQRCKTGCYTRGHDYPITGTILIVQCATGFHIEGSTLGRPGMDCHVRWEIDPRNLGNWWENISGRYIYDPNDVFFGQIKYYVVQGYVAGVGAAITVTGATALTKTNLHA